MRGYREKTEKRDEEINGVKCEREVKGPAKERERKIEIDRER